MLVKGARRNAALASQRKRSSSLPRRDLNLAALEDRSPSTAPSLSIVTDVRHFSAILATLFHFPSERSLPTRDNGRTACEPDVDLSPLLCHLKGMLYV